MKNYKTKKVALSEIFEVDKKLIEPKTSQFDLLPFIGLENITSNTREYTEEEGYNPPASNCFYFNEKHILYGKLRPYLNKVYLPEKEGKCSMEILPLLPKNGYSREFIAALIQSGIVMDMAVKFSTGGRMPRANMDKMMKMIVDLPVDVDICNEIGLQTKIKMVSQKQMREAAQKQEEAVNALEDSVLREVFPYKEGDNLPSGWIKQKLGGREGLAIIVTGNTPSRSEMENYGGVIPWIKPEDLDTNMYLESSKEFLSDTGAKNARIIPPNSIMVSCIGNIGKMGISKCRLATNQQINSLVLKSGYDTEYVYYAVKHKMSNLKGINASLLSILNASDFGKLEIPIPKNKAEQTTIAGRISERIINLTKMQKYVIRQRENIEVLPSAILRQTFAFN